MNKLGAIFSAVLLMIASMARGEDAALERTEDVIYGRKSGAALTMDVFTPPKPNGLGVVHVVSGGWI